MEINVTAMGPQGERPLTEGVAYALLHCAPYRFSNLLLGSLRQFYLCGCSLNGRTRNFIVLQEQFPPFEDKPCCEKRSPQDSPRHLSAAQSRNSCWAPSRSNLCARSRSRKSSTIAATCGRLRM